MAVRLGGGFSNALIRDGETGRIMGKFFVDDARRNTVNMYRWQGCLSARRNAFGKVKLMRLSSVPARDAFHQRSTLQNPIYYNEVKRQRKSDCRRVHSTHSKDVLLPKTLVSTPIFYVNGSPHIGHAHTSVLCDAYARWLRLKGHDVIFSTGTDEHGSKIETAARKAKYSSIKEYCDAVSGQFKDLVERLGCSNDVFFRTTDETHKENVQRLWTRLEKSGLVERGIHKGWYCESDEAFLTDSQVLPHPSDPKKRISAESNHTCEWIEESNYVFLVPKFKEELLKWVDGGSVHPQERCNEVSSFLRQSEIRPLSISRPASRVAWAIRAPSDDAEAIYVWLDALTNYLTVTSTQIETDPAVPICWGSDVDRVIHVIGKDILRFHCVYWPSLLFGAGLRPPDRVVAHAHWTVDHAKMSKSLGNVVCPISLLEMYGRDAVRFFLLRNGGLEQDSDFSHELFKVRHAELSNALGNLLSRCVAGNLLKQKHWPLSSSNKAFKRTDFANDFLLGLSEKVDKHYTDFHFAKGVEEIMCTIREANRVFTAEEPWMLAKAIRLARESQSQGGKPPDPALQEKIDLTLFWSLEALRICAILLGPVIPNTSQKIFDILGITLECRTIASAERFTNDEEAKSFVFNKPSSGSVVLFPKVT